MKYPNIIGVLGLCTRDGQIRNQKQLVDVIKEKNLYEAKVYQWEDPEADYIWCVFYNGELEDTIENVANYIIDNDVERFW